MSSTVVAGGIEISSNSETAAEMTAALTKSQDKDSEVPRALVDGGKPVEEDGVKGALSKAAAELGKKGGDAAAKKRAEAEKAKPAPPEKKAAETPEDEDEEPEEEAPAADGEKDRR